jgi:glycosyltransferase involved in cell wall biosynthesis
MEEAVEIVIVDGGSTDDTEQVIRGYQASFPGIRYIKSIVSDQTPSNEGFDRDCNYAVEVAEGEYCWLMTDDDLLLPGAIRTILAASSNGYPLIVVSAEIRSKDFTQLLVARRPDLAGDRTYTPSDWNEFAATLGYHLTFVGAVIVSKRFWLTRNRDKYIGSGFIHMGAIFDEPVNGEILAISSPLVSIRYGNALWSTRAFEIWMFNWPQLVWSFSSITVEAKAAITPMEPWRNLRTLLIQRMFGAYTIRQYRQFLDARIPSKTMRFLAAMLARFPRRLLLLLAFTHALCRSPRNKILLLNLKNSWNT